MVPDAAPPTGWATGVEPDEGATLVPVVSLPGYLAIAWEGVMPLSTASVRSMTRLVEAVDALALAAELPPLNLPVVHVGFTWTEYVRHVLAKISARRKCPSAS